MQEGTKIHAGSTGFFRLSHRAWQAEEPRLTKVLKEGLQGWVYQWIPDTVVRRRGSGWGATLSW